MRSLPSLLRALTVALCLGALGPGVAAATAGPVAGAAALPCDAPARAGNLSLTLQSGGRTRTALLHLPRAPAGRALPLIVALHGAGGNGPDFADDSGLSIEGDEYGFAVVYPSSFGAQWAISKSQHDVVFVGQLLDQIEGLACLDPRRISAVGVSIGAGMAARIGCELSSRIAGLVLVSGGYRSLPACTPDRPVSVLEIHGTSDTTVPYGGQASGNAGAVLPYIAAWAGRDRCKPTPTKRVVAAHTLLYAWGGCASGASVQHLRIYGGRHGLPNAASLRISGGDVSPISGVRNIWHFLASRTLGRPFPPAPAPNASP